MQIRPISFTDDSQGLPAEGWAYHIGLPNESPLIDDNKIKVFDGYQGPQTSNPFYVDKYGHFVNDNGDNINPISDGQTYSIAVIASDGELVKPIETVVSDAILDEDLTTSEYQAVIDNLEDPVTGAKAQDLSAFERVYIQSIDPNWQDTIDGPVGGFAAHRDGTNGPKGEGNQNQFYDSTGTGFTRDQAQRVKVDDATITIDTATNEIRAAAATIPNFIDGLVTSWNEIDEIGVAQGECVDSTAAVLMAVSSQAMGFANDVSGGGNRTGGVIQNNTWYHLFVVSEEDGSNTRLAFDTNINAVDALSEWSAETGETYDKYRIFGSVLTNGSGELIEYYQYDSRFVWATEQVDTSTPSTATPLTLQTPINLECLALMRSYMVAVSDGGTPRPALLAAQGDQTDSSLVEKNALISSSSGTNRACTAIFEIYTNASSEIKYEYNNNTFVNAQLACQGFIHPRK